MAVIVIDTLEVVEIQHKQTKGSVHFVELLQIRIKSIFEIASVRQFRQGVGYRLFFERLRHIGHIAGFIVVPAHHGQNQSDNAKKGTQQ